MLDWLEKFFALAGVFFLIVRPLWWFFSGTAKGIQEARQKARQ